MTSHVRCCIGTCNGFQYPVIGYTGVFCVYKEFLLAVSVSIDTYLAAAAYSGNNIRIPLFSSVMISFICAAVLGVCTALSGFLESFIRADICHIIGLIALILIGCITIAKSLVRSLVRYISDSGERTIKMRGTPLIIKLYLDDTAADIDKLERACRIDRGGSVCVCRLI